MHTFNFMLFAKYTYNFISDKAFWDVKLLLGVANSRQWPVLP